MHKFEDLNYYELFEIPVNASHFEIRQAYRNALSIYGDDSIIAHSFFTTEERTKILQRIEDAFSTLINDTEREAYDKGLVAKKIIDSSSLAIKRKNAPTPLFSSKSPGGDAVSKKIKRAIKERNLQGLVDEILSSEAISGNHLQRLRAAVGITLDDVFEVTRISVATLEAIENDHIESLPPTVYLRNFLKAYAELFEADAQKIIAGYLKSIERIRASS
ncbi:MAG: helix-turn-helix domain-containing protein [Candidatus Desulfacyla sp.]